ncbi:MAG: magnesium transporter [Acidobacteria bacterium]|nr:magnesium transporter [Acidobacteriota bacterium]
MAVVALSELLGTAVYSSTGSRCGRVREVAVAPGEDRSRISSFVVRTRGEDHMVAASSIVAADPYGLHTVMPKSQWAKVNGAHGGEGLLMLERDLLDQQIIDVHGRKVVRVNDAEIVVEPENSHLSLKITAVDVGSRGMVRRLLKGLVPAEFLRRIAQRFGSKVIPWEFVDLIETDPARRVKLRISHDRLAKMHPADIADIIEELAPAERGAVMESLDEGVAAEALEELDPKMQVSILSALDSEKAADIVQEMDPDAAADLLGDLPPEQSEEILEEMEPAEREEVAELLQHEENTAAGRMTTDYLALSPRATVADAAEALRRYEGDATSVATIFLVSEDWKLQGAVPLSALVAANQEKLLTELAGEETISCPPEASEKEVAETFDKYNLLTLPVVDHEGRLIGVITADDVISWLRKRE